MPKLGPRTTNKYSARFKATAVRFSRLPAVAVQDVAESLYIHPFMLSRWRKEAREGKIMTKGIELDEATAAELQALRRLKRDYERLKLEHGRTPAWCQCWTTRPNGALPPGANAG